MAPAAVVLIAAGALSFTKASSLPSPPAPFHVVEDRGDARFDATTNVFAVSRIAIIEVTAPFTLLRATPRRLDHGLELFAVRVGFWGRAESRTSSRYLRENGMPGLACGEAPITGHGPTYPAEGIRLMPGDDTVVLIGYFRATAPGRHGAYGYRIDFALPDSRRGTVSGEGLETHITGWTPGTAPTDDRFFAPYCRQRRWTTPYPGYPN